MRPKTCTAPAFQAACDRELERIAQAELSWRVWRWWWAPHGGGLP
jgi:hypothetical protein